MAIDNRIMTALNQESPQGPSPQVAPQVQPGIAPVPEAGVGEQELMAQLDSILNDDNTQKDPVSNATDIDIIAETLIKHQQVIFAMTQRMVQLEEILEKAMGMAGVTPTPELQGVTQPEVPV